MTDDTPQAPPTEEFHREQVKIVLRNGLFFMITLEFQDDNQWGIWLRLIRADGGICLPHLFVKYDEIAAIERIQAPNGHVLRLVR